ncbi:iron ABC transporter permease [uncultured Sphaerochaeta sp.]|uniref:FecCD family ABC transporter permease n=1 Tax=uncultured Sphaerochaeta sp. TaxID=886478 RepID=UPI002A0A1550|nr:iron ABC transporter permease [uncultured Sphaerochaeta sp.]
MKRHPRIILGICILLLGIASLGLGPAKISFADTFSTLFGKNLDASQIYIIRDLRLPRILSAIFCGAILGSCGAVFQAALRNPMADPFVLGVSSGASFGVALSISLGYSSIIGLPFSALVGALLTTLFIFSLGMHTKVSKTTLLLTGVATNYILSAGMTLLMFLHHEQYDRILFWTMGSFSSSTWSQVIYTFIVSLLCIIPLSLKHRDLDMLLLDEGSALSGGFPMGRARILFLLLATLGVATCVSFFGVIGFIGLMAPHVIRLILGPSHKHLLLPTAMFGSLLLLGSDTLSRIILPSGEMPVGVITSLLGAPLFVWMLKKGRSDYV